MEFRNEAFVDEASGCSDQESNESPRKISYDNSIWNQKQRVEIQPFHFSCTFQNMNRLRKEGWLCDVTIKVGALMIPAHKIVLASASPYFEAMFTNNMIESREDIIELHEMDPASVEHIIDFIYTGNLDISEDNVQTILSVSNIIQVEQIRAACCNFLSMQLSPCNCLGILMFADMHGCVDLLKTSMNYALSNFTEVSRTEDFLLLNRKRLLELISNDCLHAHDESQVFLAVMNWIKNDVTTRKQYLHEVLSLVKLPLLNRDFLMFTVEPDELIRSNTECKDLVIEAMKYHLLPEMRTYLHNIRTRSRERAGLSTLLMIFGGNILFGIHCECECYDAQSNKWFKITSMTTRRTRLGAGTVFGNVYAVGGFDGIDDLASTEVYNPKSDAWTCTTPMGTCRSSLGVSVLHNLLYAIGGFDGRSCLCSVERFDPLLQQWTSVAPMICKRRDLTASALGEYIIVAGGNDQSTNLNSVELYDPVTNVWTLKCPMRERRSNASSAVINEHFYITGGDDGSSYLDTVERYNIQDNSWVQLASLSSIRSSHIAIAMDGFIYVIGGNRVNSIHKSIERYDPKDNTWKKFGSMSMRRSNFGAVVAGVKARPLCSS